MKKRLHLRLVDVADEESHSDGTLVRGDSLDRSRDVSGDAAPAGAEVASASPPGVHAGLLGRSASGSGRGSGRFQLDATRRSSSGLNRTREGLMLRETAKKVMKSLESEILKDQKRIRLVHEIYDASERIAEEGAGAFVSPLRRRYETSKTDGFADLFPRAEAEAEAEDPDAASEENRKRGTSIEPSSSETTVLEAKRPGAREETQSPSGGLLSRSEPSGSSIDSRDQPKGGALDVEAENVWFECVRLLRVRVWIFLDDPDSSPSAYFISICIVVLIVISSVTFCLETMSSFEAPKDKAAFWVIECICISAFTAEYGLKLATCPNIKKFVAQPLNAVDLISILPFYFGLVISSVDGGSSRIFRTIRLVRVFRVVKLGSRSGKLQVVTRTMSESLDMLAMMLFLLALTVLVFATLVYFAERGDYYEDDDLYARNVDITCSELALASGSLTAEDGSLVAGCERTASPFKSIPDAFWWTMVTLMTVGYGDQVPVTDLGRFVGCLAMLASVILMALPISVIGSEFTQQWLAYKKCTTENAGRARGAAPRFAEVSSGLKAHLQVLDEILRKMRDAQVSIEERLLRVKQIVRAREKEQHALRRKAFTRGNRAVEQLFAEKRARDSSGGDRRLRHEVQQLLDEREQLRKAAHTAEVMVSGGLPEIVTSCLDKCEFLNELKQDDYELLVADIEKLNFQALRWHAERVERVESARVGTGGRFRAVERRCASPTESSSVPRTPQTQGRDVEVARETPPESVGPRL